PFPIYRQYLLKRIASGFLLRPFKRTKPYYNTLSKRLFRLLRVLKYLAIFYTKLCFLGMPGNPNDSFGYFLVYQSAALDY
ncbi:MAG: hypothetical protein B6D55_06665, partial [Candidatus Omnitrophica bacterium 4484_70.2]